MNYYTSTIPPTLAEKLKEKGMPLMTSMSISIVEDKPVVDENGEQWYRPTYAEVFDWLMSKKRQYIWIEPHFRVSGERFSFRINFSSDERIFDTWHEAAEKAIEKALELI